LAFFLLKYGWDKIVLLQFYKPAPNILYTNFGYLSQDIAFWSLIGSNPGLSRGIGVVELITGVLLFLPRFRFLAAALSMGFFAIIVGINFSFDISVKQLSIALFFWSMLLLVSYPEKYKILLGLHGQTTLQPNSAPFKKYHFLFYMLLVAECFSSTIRTGDFNFQNNTSLVPVTAFAIADHPIYTAIFTHSQGYVIIEYKSGKKKDYHIENLDQFTPKNIQFKIGTLDLQGKQLLLDKKKFSLETLPITQLPMQSKSWHFFSDSFH
jgi:hypothetical protein